MPRPLPTPDHESAEFWRRVRAHRFALQRCTACRAFRFYPRAVCPECLAGGFEWVEATGRGTLYSFTVCHRPASEAFADRVPYIVALVELQEGVRVLANLLDCAPERARVGMAVTLGYDDTADDITLYQFKPA